MAGPEDAGTRPGGEAGGSQKQEHEQEPETPRPTRSRQRTQGSRVVVHPILFAAFPILFLWAHNLDQGVDLDEVVRPILLSVGVAAALWAIGTRILHDARRAGLVVSVLALMFFSFGYLVLAVGNVSHGNTAMLLAGWCVLAAIAVVFILRGGAWVPSVTNGFNIAAVVLVGMNLFTVVWAQVDPGAGSTKSVLQGAPTLPPSLLASPPAHRPDVYYIIFDEYGGTRTLQDFFDYDSEPLMKWLQGKGFVLPAHSATNYPRTELALASSMNLRYLGFLTAKMGPNTGNITPITNLLQHAQIGTIMKSLGYDYIHIGSWLNQTRTAVNADVNLTHGGSDFSNLLKQEPATSQAFRTEAWRTTLWQLSTTEHLQRYTGPRFVFTHILCPHGPLVFERDGSLLPRSTLDREGEKQAYVDQHYWIDQQIRKLVTSLQDRPADQQPVIVLQADEGPYPGEPTIWPPHPNPNQLEMKFDILNAYYLPGIPKSAVWPDITPVNTFRLILDEYFHAKLTYLPDREYAFADLMRHLYVFHDVTRLVHASIWGRPPAPRPIPPGASDRGSCEDCGY
ncbi:MAG TPA: sulfatase-like hydrolase/transferase [Actinomycetota bacterium]|nr:sulfatase-like hydrolase/transferase [Actinomycetota bacterium]